LLADPGRVVLLLWAERDVLLDGHNRYTICQKHNLPYEIKSVSLPDIGAAKLWIVNEHLDRRQFADEQKSFWRGTQYEWEKQASHRPEEKAAHNLHVAPEEKGAQSEHLKTRERVAKKHKVSKSTIERDARFARAVDEVDERRGIEADSRSQ